MNPSLDKFCFFLPQIVLKIITIFSSQIDEIRQIMEARHADHYAIINLAERKYNGAQRFPRGKCIDADWSAQVEKYGENKLSRY